ncbi:3-keto-disaccharide hydrolase [Kordiimonas sp.]|uniref:3-keto-disaccharide hydrolase n=1 Tax=Kordiimonas sp. TaxID=1970157 RepID=UPI003A8E2F86
MANTGKLLAFSRTVWAHAPLGLALVLGSVLGSLLAAQNTAAHADDAGWQALFNGKDLSGWQMKFAGRPLGENYKNTFRVEDGVIRANYDDYQAFEGRFGHLFWQTPYSNYRLRFEYRFTGHQTAGAPGWAFRNSGVMVHAQAPESMTTDQDFPVSIEVQLLGQQGSDARPTGNVCTPGTHIHIDGKLVKDHCITSRAGTHTGDDWVHAEVVVRGGALIQHLINGELVMEYSHPQYDLLEPDTRNLKPALADLSQGYIAFQAESHPVEFRNIYLKLLDTE